MLTRTPFTRVPLVDPRSTTANRSPWGRTSAWLRLTFGSASTRLQSGCRPTLITDSVREKRSPLGSTSEPAPAPRTTEDQVDDLAKLLKVADIRQPIILVAWSLGGWNAMVYAARHPDDVAGLVLIDVRPPTASARWLAELPAETPGESEALAGNRDEFTTFELDPSLNPEGLDLRASSAQAAAAKYGGRPVTFLWAKNTAEAWEGLEPELAARLDRVALDLRAEMEAQVAGATSIVVDASHDIAGDNPDAVIEAIRSLLAKV